LILAVRFFTVISIIFFCLSQLVFLTHTYGQIIFPGVYGEDLRDSLVVHYKPTFTLGYDGARDFMFGILDNKDDSVKCVYTGYTIYLDPDSPLDPRTVAYNAGLDTEHSWPQSLGAEGQAKSDLHHLFPTKRNVNSDRGNLPFNFIPSDNADRWFRLDQVINTPPNSPPTQFVDEYSRVDFNVSFETRDDHKGNVARAIFYFYTMYKEQSEESFFEVQKDVLRIWNSLDPVDANEQQRNSLIAEHQDGKINPFIQDTTLIGRLYFGVTAIFNANRIHDNHRSSDNLSVYPNPFNSSTTLRFYVQGNSRVGLKIFDLRGRILENKIINCSSGGWKNYIITTESWPSGAYFVKLSLDRTVHIHKIILMK
jgi:hypothetical protein